MLKSYSCSLCGFLKKNFFNEGCMLLMLGNVSQLKNTVQVHYKKKPKKTTACLESVLVLQHVNRWVQADDISLKVLKGDCSRTGSVLIMPLIAQIRTLLFCKSSEQFHYVILVYPAGIKLFNSNNRFSWVISCAWNFWQKCSETSWLLNSTKSCRWGR